MAAAHGRPAVSPRAAHGHANALYAAERRAFGKKMWTLDDAPALADAQAIVDRHVRGWTVERCRSGGCCYEREKRIALSRSAGLPVVLHELAHAKAGNTDRGHGRLFMVTFLLLVEREMGVYWRRRLLKSIEIFQPRGWRQVVELIRDHEQRAAAGAALAVAEHDENVCGLCGVRRPAPGLTACSTCA